MIPRNDEWIKNESLEIEIEFVMERCSIIRNVRIDFTFPALCRYSGAREHIAVVWRKRGAGSSVKTEK